MAQNGGTRGRTFHGEMDRCRGSQGWTTAFSSMPELDEKDQGEDSPKQADSCWFACHSGIATGGANLSPTGIWSADVMCRFSLVLRLFVLFRFCPFVFSEAAALRSIVLRSSMCMRRADSHTQLPNNYLVTVFVFFCFCFFGNVSFSVYFCTTTVLSLFFFVCVCVFSPSGLRFLSCDHELDS